ncbi:hypothetical protein AS594_07170 [Streptomyces agglomeratus]|uniref:Uncharacterized protein n=1 Tax=Streptomyces agglomeratus TaxID=285458 RepID=A0A1E5P437_9ACTN|nr:hypothetical protein [Streptomyces agglomeratus]OEJ24303.1 hypothetical protein AS594_07170 [Streptomyces agglomeratus]
MLSLKTKTPVRFEWSDGDVETTVTLDPGEDENVLIRKLKRIVALAEGEPALPTRDPAAPSLPAPYRPPVHSATVQANGWAELAKPLAAPPELPEDRQGEWELIKPGEDA